MGLDNSLKQAIPQVSGFLRMFCRIGSNLIKPFLYWMDILLLFYYGEFTLLRAFG